MISKHYRILYKVIFGLLGLSSVATEIIVLIARGTFNPANFFSFFTILSNCFAVVMLLFSAYYLLNKQKSIRLDYLRGAATLYMTMTGVIFAVLLAGLDSDVLTAVPWDNVVLHYIMPIALFVDWLINPPSTKMAFKRSLWWLVFPIAYVTYSLIRGSIVGWYPYPFLNPANGGYASIAVVCIAITIFTVLAARVVALTPQILKTK